MKSTKNVFSRLVIDIFYVILIGMPTVAIVGRPNVGKSALFNRLAGRKIAIVHDQPGVTRDRLSAPCKITTHPCDIVDTGGIGATLDDGFAEQVAFEVDIAIATADLILFVVDAHEGLTPIDLALGQKLRKAKSPTLLVLNKVDHDNHEAAWSDFAKLGLGDGLAVSAEHGRQFYLLTDAIDAALAPMMPAEGETPETRQPEGIRIAIVGKPNAGKSSLANAIVQDERTIVSDIAGTTRDAVDLPCTFKGEHFTLIDTAGLRPRAKRDTSVEVFSAMRTEKAIRRADLTLLVIDLATGITAQDRKIAQLILEENKPCLIVLNKFDLYHPGAKKKSRIEEATEHVKRELFFLNYAPFAIVSAKTNESVEMILKEAIKIRNQSRTIPGTGQLNRILQKAIEKNPPPVDSKLKKRMKLYYGTVATDKTSELIPVPTYILFLNDKKLLNQSYKQYLIHQLRESHPAPGIPVVFSPRSRERRDLSSETFSQKGH
jgi:GTP-binding protein